MADLDLPGTDLVPAGLDDVDRGPADDAVEPDVVDDDRIAGDEPAIDVVAVAPAGQVPVEQRRPRTWRWPTVSPSWGAGWPSSPTWRVCTPWIGTPTQPGRRSPSARVLSVISVSVIPYRSTGARPVSSTSSSNTGTGSGALPDTRSRAERSARAAAGSAQTRDHTVGTPK